MFISCKTTYILPCKTAYILPCKTTYILPCKTIYILPCKTTYILPCKTTYNFAILCNNRFIILAEVKTVMLKQETQLDIALQNLTLEKTKFMTELQNWMPPNQVRLLDWYMPPLHLHHVRLLDLEASC